MVQFFAIKGEHLVLDPEHILSLQDAGLRGGAFAMRPLDPEHLEHLLLSNPTEWPPILVTRCDQGYILIDGYHRWETARRLKRDHLYATCEAFSHENEVIEAAFRANLSHGLKADNTTRSDYAYWLHVTYPGMEQAEIARRAGIAQSSVSRAITRREEALRSAREAQGEENEQERREQMSKVCRSFTRGALRFLAEIDGLDDGEVMQHLERVIKRRDERAKLERIGRLLNGGFSTV